MVAASYDDTPTPTSRPTILRPVGLLFNNNCWFGVGGYSICFVTMVVVIRLQRSFDATNKSLETQRWLSRKINKRSTHMLTSINCTIYYTIILPVSAGERSTTTLSSLVNQSFAYSNIFYHMTFVHSWSNTMDNSIFRLAACLCQRWIDARLHLSNLALDVHAHRLTESILQI